MKPPTPLKILNDMLKQENREKYPDIPVEWLYVKPMKDKTSNQLTQAIIKFIQLSGGQAERISVTGRRIDERKTFTDVLGQTRQIGSVRWIKSSMQAGTADISATIRGRSVKIEVKIGRDHQRPAQAEYQRQVEAAGGMYVIATSFDQFYEWYHGFIGSTPRVP